MVDDRTVSNMKWDLQCVYVTLQNCGAGLNIFILFHFKPFPLVIPLVAIMLFSRELLELLLDDNRLALKDHTRIFSPFFSSLNTLHHYFMLYRFIFWSFLLSVPSIVIHSHAVLISISRLFKLPVLVCSNRVAYLLSSKSIIIIVMQVKFRWI